jgi:hypothetical protein
LDWKTQVLGLLLCIAFVGSGKSKKKATEHTAVLFSSASLT